MQNHVVQGVLALVGGREVAVGNSSLLAGQGICLNDEQAAEEAAWQAKGARVHRCTKLCDSSRRAQRAHASNAADLEKVQQWVGSCAGATVVWVAIDNIVAGLAAVADQPRAGAAAAVCVTCSMYKGMAITSAHVACLGFAALCLQRRNPAAQQPATGLTSRQTPAWNPPSIIQTILLPFLHHLCVSGQRHPAPGAAHGHADGRLRRRSSGGGRRGGAAAGGRARQPAAGRQARQGGNNLRV
jgi:hypothetical protein